MTFFVITNYKSCVILTLLDVHIDESLGIIWRLYGGACMTKNSILRFQPQVHQKQKQKLS